MPGILDGWSTFSRHAATLSSFTVFRFSFFMYFLSSQYPTMNSTYLHPKGSKPATNAGDGIHIFIICRTRMTTRSSRGILHATYNTIARPTPVAGMAAQDAQNCIKTSSLDLRPSGPRAIQHWRRLRPRGLADLLARKRCVAPGMETPPRGILAGLECKIARLLAAHAAGPFPQRLAMARHINIPAGADSSVLARGQYLWYKLPNTFLDRSTEKGRGFSSHPLPSLVYWDDLRPPSRPPAH